MNKHKSKTDADESSVRLVGSGDVNDSDVKVLPSSKNSGVNKKSQNPSDSDIRLHDLPSVEKKKRRDDNIITEEIDLDAEEARVAEKSKKGREGGRAKPTMISGNPSLPTQSPFEISEPDLNLDKPSARTPRKRTSQVETSSDYELVPFDAGKSPGHAGGNRPDHDEDVHLGSEVAGGHGANSGINLDDPADGGISLESGGSDELAFDLSLDEGMTPKPAKSTAPKEDSSSEFELTAGDSSSDLSIGKSDGENSSSEFDLSVDDSEQASSSEFELSLDGSDEGSDLDGGDSNSDSEFELTLDDDGGLAGSDDDGKDIFEETNFDVPALDDSGSEAVALEHGDTDLEGSDFEISLDEDSSAEHSTGSAVVNLDEEEEADAGAATVARVKRPAKKGQKISGFVDDESEVDIDIEDSAPALKPGRRKPVIDDVDEDESDEVERPAAAAAPADWGVFPAIMLIPTVMVLFIVGLMGFELVRGMWGYQRPSPVGKPVIDSIARMVDDTLPK